MDNKVLFILLGLWGLCYAAGCGKVFENGITQEDSQIIVDEHNKYRIHIANGTVPGQPRGVNLKRMKYDYALAVEAQKIADSCTFAHQTVQDDRWAVGQNLYIVYYTRVSSDAPNWPSAIQKWFDEYKLYNFATCCQGFTVTGHYTQVVWASTEYVGCGYTYYTNDFFTYQKLYVCNYGPAGNYVGEFPYQTGDAGCENLC